MAQQLLVDTTQPFTRADLTRAGQSDQVARRVEHVKLITGVFIHRDFVTALALIRAALLIHPAAAYASHISAAIVLGLPVPEHGFAHVTVGRPRDRRYRPQIKCHVTKRRQKVMVVGGIRTTDPVATFIDCAGWLSLVDLVVLGDALAKKYKIKAADLRRACARSTDYYAGLARTAAAFVRDGVDSPMETRLRMLIVLAGLPEPTVNFKIHWADGRLRFRLDLSFPGLKLIIEYDGRQHAENSAQWNSDLKRREALEKEDWTFLIVTATNFYRETEQTLLRIRDRLIQLGMPDVPPIDDRWREHFGS